MDDTTGAAAGAAQTTSHGLAHSRHRGDEYRRRSNSKKNRRDRRPDYPNNTIQPDPCPPNTTTIRPPSAPHDLPAAHERPSAVNGGDPKHQPSLPSPSPMSMSMSMPTPTALPHPVNNVPRLPYPPLEICDPTPTSTTTLPNTAIMLHNAPTPSYNDIICTHLHQYGFLQGFFSDLTILVRVAGANSNTQAPNPNADTNTVSFKSHKILAIRSQMLAHLISQAELTTPTSYPLEVTLPVIDSNLTYEGLSAVHLHLQDLAATVTNLIKNDVSRTTVSRYCEFLATADYGPYSTEIREAVFTYLAKGSIGESFDCTNTPINYKNNSFKKTVIWPSRDTEAYIVLVRTFADLPFEWLKRVLESKDFEVPEDMDRYLFAKEVIQRRARASPTHGTSSPIPPPVAGEENVLLAFGTGSVGNISGVKIPHCLVRRLPPENASCGSLATDVYAR
ncbi:hypothetical protein SeMB42_g03314 [Synchytrium endobioticum]|uniref:BTB domain-containing protein n=1 Tax=Synchytrium endobioticum TaxID=286115 RepID=A0A507D7J4_9FUNG|nr:hypothetical protein SeMB42_g03314 [Synchytrium endobioticum]